MNISKLNPAFFALFLFFSAGGASQAATALRCEPQEIQNFPKNTKVTIESVGSQLRMTVSTFFYGAQLDEHYVVTRSGNTFVGDGVKLVLSNERDPTGRGMGAILDDAKDGQVALFCNEVGRR